MASLPIEAVGLQGVSLDLIHGPLHRFAAWPNAGVPAEPGVYTIWDVETASFIYAGMAGRGGTAGSSGLRGRLGSHASGRRSGDQFCIYVADRLLLPTLSPAQVRLIADGELSFDTLVRRWICDRLGYRWTTTSSAREALALEADLRAGRTPCGMPLLNPPRRRA
jgi:hypothetical protein